MPASVARRVAVGGISWRYLIALSVDEGRIWNDIQIAEYIATTDAFERHRDAVRKVLAGD